MPFPTDATWPAGLLKICRREPQQPENRYYGPYNKLLTYYFNPDSFEYFVAPPNPSSASSSRDTVDFVVFLVVFDAHRRPVLIAEIKDDSWVDRADLRFKADDQNCVSVMTPCSPIAPYLVLEIELAWNFASRLLRCRVRGPFNLNSKTTLATATLSPATFLRGLGVWTFFH